MKKTNMVGSMDCFGNKHLSIFVLSKDAQNVRDVFV